MNTFAVGDKVRHTTKFLRSIAWFLDVPRFGTVTKVTAFHDQQLVTVEWCEFLETMGILGCNLEITKRLI